MPPKEGEGGDLREKVEVEGRGCASGEEVSSAEQVDEREQKRRRRNSTREIFQQKFVPVETATSRNLVSLHTSRQYN